ncbi:MAG TPA: serine hydrolase [Candidatus Saccharimonadales bacterium]|nr:serine hydrolase [Candidatus Saccharimonadales bacterium]
MRAIRQRAVSLGLAVLCLVLLASNVYWFHTARSNAGTGSKTYPLLSRRAQTNQQTNILINFVPLRKELQSEFNQLNVQHSFYFEYLPSGTSIKIGADNELVAASLIKVPLVMNLYKAVELGKLRLDQKVTITASELDDAYGTLYQRGAGTSITLQQAAQYALEQSDNTAAHVIYDHVQNLLTDDQQSLAQLDIDQTIQNGQAVIDAKSYASILNSLYLSSYLKPQDSQAILSDLTLSNATNRLTAELPKTLVVAHKIGVYNATWSESDCGIVYVPNRPYIICVMVGLPDDQANTFIAKVSKQVYDYVSHQ